MRRQIADRLFLCGLNYAVVAVSLCEPASLSYLMVKIGGWPALLSMLVLALATTVALLDTVINDCLPARYSLHTALRVRQGIWMLIAITYAGHVSVILRANTGFGVAAFYFIYGCRCAAVAFLDLFYQYYITVTSMEKVVEPTTDHGVLDA